MLLASESIVINVIVINANNRYAEKQIIKQRNYIFVVIEERKIGDISMFD